MRLPPQQRPKVDHGANKKEKKKNEKIREIFLSVLNLVVECSSVSLGVTPGSEEYQFKFHWALNQV